MKEENEKKYWEELEHKKKRSVTHPVVNFYSNQRINYMRKHLDDFKSIKTALDVGAGYGYSSYHMPKSINTLALDFSFMNLISNPVKNNRSPSAAPPRRPWPLPAGPGRPWCSRGRARPRLASSSASPR